MYNFIDLRVRNVSEKSSKTLLSWLNFKTNQICEVWVPSFF